MKTGNELLDKFIYDLQSLIKELMVGMIDQQLENEAERAQAEREAIVSRVQEGVTLAKRRIEAEGGQWGGRKAIIVTPEIREILDLWNDRRILQSEALERLKVFEIGRTTAYKLKKSEKTLSNKTIQR